MESPGIPNDLLQRGASRPPTQEIARQWKELLEKNYHRALDHRSFYFRQQEKRVVLPRHLVHEVREKHNQAVAAAAASAAAAAAAQSGVKLEEPPAEVPHLV